MSEILMKSPLIIENLTEVSLPSSTTHVRSTTFEDMTLIGFGQLPSSDNLSDGASSSPRVFPVTKIVLTTFSRCITPYIMVLEGNRMSTIIGLYNIIVISLNFLLLIFVIGFKIPMPN